MTTYKRKEVIGGDEMKHIISLGAQEPDREKNRSNQFLRGLEGVAAIDNARKGKGEGS